jgi:hypothetical protein
MKEHARARCYAKAMTQKASALLEAFESLPAEEKRVFTDEILRRSLPFDSGALTDEEINTASSQLFEWLDEDDSGAR